MKKPREQKTFSYLSHAFIVGAGSSFDIAGNYHHSRYRKFLNISDSQALQKDWEAIGNDMRKAIEELSKNNTNTNSN
jgi:hypothetical protein